MDKIRLTQYLRNEGVEYWTEGTNVSKGWIGIKCLFCDDKSNHLGIRIEDLKVRCWKCGGHQLVNLVKKISNCNFNEAKKITKTLARSGAVSDYQPPLDKSSSDLIVRLPAESSKKFPMMHIQYLKERNFYPQEAIDKFDLRAVGAVGEYKFRIILPIYMDEILMSFTSRDITDRQELRYKDCPINKSRVKPDDCIYNYDGIKDGGRALLMEGPTDVWKFGDNSFAIFGAAISAVQILSIMKKNLHTLFIMLDPDKTGEREGPKIARKLSPLAEYVEIVYLKRSGRDPGELSYSEVSAIKKELGLL